MVDVLVLRTQGNELLQTLRARKAAVVEGSDDWHRHQYEIELVKNKLRDIEIAMFDDNVSQDVMDFIGSMIDGE